MDCCYEKSTGSSSSRNGIAGQEHHVPGRSQLGTWHRQPSQPEPPRSTLAASMLPELEQSDARQQRLSHTGHANQIYSSQHQPTVQQDTPAVSSSPPDPSTVSVPDAQQQPSPTACSDAMQHLCPADTQHVGGSHAIAASHAPDGPGSSALRPPAHSKHSSLELSTGNASHPVVSRASGAQGHTHGGVSALALAAASCSAGHQPAQSTQAASVTVPDATHQAHPPAMLTSDNVQTMTDGRSSHIGAHHQNGCVMPRKRSR